MRTSGALAMAVRAIGGALTGCAGSGGGGGGGAPPKPACKPPAVLTISFAHTIQPIFDRSCPLVSSHKRTAFAHIHAHDIEHDLDLLPVPPGVKPFNGEINSYASIGGDLRVQNITVFQDRPNRLGRVPTNEAFRRSVRSNDSRVFEFLAYGQVDLLPDFVTLYADEDFTSGATNREAFGMIRGFLPWDTYVKAGRLFPAYGPRVQDH